MPGLAKPVAAVSGRRGEPLAFQEPLYSAPGSLSLPPSYSQAYSSSAAGWKGSLLAMLQSILSFPLNKTLSKYSSLSYFLRVYSVPGAILGLRDPTEVTGLASGEVEQQQQQHIRSLSPLGWRAPQSRSSQGAGLGKSGGRIEPRRGRGAPLLGAF